jgi:hypothetical protein
MKWPACIFLLAILWSFHVTGQTLGMVRSDTNTLSFQARYGDKVTLSVRHIFYKDENGDTGPTADSYILEVVNGYYPVIVDGIYGHDLSFQLLPNDGTNEQKLLIFYHAGGNAYHVKIYTIDEVNIIPLKTQPVGSNMGHIQFIGKNITVENQEFNNDNSASLYTDTYQVVGDECKLIKEEKKILPPEIKNSAKTVGTQ